MLTQCPPSVKTSSRYDSSLHASPPRQRRCYDSSPDASPPRRDQRHDSPDASPPRRKRQDSPDASPPRRAQRHDSPDASPPRRKRQDSPDASPPRHRENAAAPEHPAHGLVTGAQLKAQNDKKRQDELSKIRYARCLDACYAVSWPCFTIVFYARSAQPELLGKGAETVHRDRKGQLQ